MDLPGHDESKALIIKGLEIRKESNYRIRLYIKTLTRGEESVSSLEPLHSSSKGTERIGIDRTLPAFQFMPATLPPIVETPNRTYSPITSASQN